MMRTRFLTAIVMLFVATLALAQDDSPRGKAETTVNGKKIAIDYGRPALKGRSLGDLTAKLPEDRMWRAGMNQVTTLETETDLMVGGKTVPAGKYSVYVHAAESGDWSLVLNSVLGQPLGKIWAQAPENMAKEPWPHFAYSKEIGDKEVARAAMKKGKADPPSDMFTIDLESAADGAKMKMSWGDAAWSLDLKAAK
jgi:hypothetical protein